MKALYPDDPRLADFDEESRVVVSEPLGDLLGMWNPVPEASWGVVQPGPDEIERLPADRHRSLGLTASALSRCRRASSDRVAADEARDAGRGSSGSGARSGR